MLSGGIQENMIKTFETHPPGCAYPGLSVHRQSRSTRLAKRLDAWRNGTAGSTIKQVWISLRCSPPPLSWWLARGRAKTVLPARTSIFGEAPTKPIFGKL